MVGGQLIAFDDNGDLIQLDDLAVGQLDQQAHCVGAGCPVSQGNIHAEAGGKLTAGALDIIAGCLGKVAEDKGFIVDVVAEAVNGLVKSDPTTEADGIVGLIQGDLYRVVDGFQLLV